MAESNDLSERLKGGSLYDVIVLLVPGSIALIPVLIIIHRIHHTAFIFNKDSESTFIFVFLVLSLALGMIFEEIGANIEDVIDARLEKTDVNINTELKKSGQLGRIKLTHLEIWEKYLVLVFDKEPVGQSFIRSVLMRLKFNLSMIGSMTSYIICAPFMCNFGSISLYQFLIVEGVAIFAIAMLTKSAHKNSVTLSEVRRQLIRFN